MNDAEVTPQEFYRSFQKSSLDGTQQALLCMAHSLQKKGYIGFILLSTQSMVIDKGSQLYLYTFMLRKPGSPHFVAGATTQPDIIDAAKEALALPKTPRACIHCGVCNLNADPDHCLWARIEWYLPIGGTPEALFTAIIGTIAPELEASVAFQKAHYKEHFFKARFVRE